MNINQINPAKFTAEFTNISTCKTKKQSFFTSLVFGFLSQCCRLQSTSHFQNPYSQILQVVSDLKAMAGLDESYKEALTEFSSYLNYSCQYAFDQYIPWLGGSDLKKITTAIRLILYVVLRTNNHPESNSVADMESVPNDDKGILRLFANKLGLVIYFIVDGYQGEMIEESLQVKPVIFIGKFDGEYCLLEHKDYSLQRFDSYPYVWSKISAPLVKVPSGVPAPASGKGPAAGKVSETILTPLLKSMIKLFLNRNWRFNQEESKKISEVLKNLKRFDFYQNEIKVLKNLIAEGKCDHSFSSYFRFKCGKLHCFECLRDEVKLKKLLKYQIFCSCKVLIPDKEAAYFFKDEIKTSYQFVSTVPIRPEDTTTLSARTVMNQPNLGYGGDMRTNDPPRFEPKMMEREAPPAFPPSGNLGGFAGPSTGAPGNLGAYGSSQISQQGPPPNPMGFPGLSSTVQQTGPPNLPPQISGGQFGPPGFQASMVGGPPGFPTSNMGMPSVPPGIPQMTGGQSGPPGIPQLSGFLPGVPSIPPGVPQGLPSGPPGIPRPPGVPDGPMFNPGLSPGPSSTESAISLPKVSFCQKCNLPINPSDLVISNNKPYHKNHV